jgi:hypothetical protein
MKIDEYNRLTPIKYALERTSDFWDDTMQHPTEHPVAEKLLIALLILGMIVLSPILISVAVSQIMWYYIDCRMTRWHATRSGNKYGSEGK